ncbi:MAG: FkbM family methyltransferase [Verrucomicrobiota bacterium]
MITTWFTTATSALWRSKPAIPRRRITIKPLENSIHRLLAKSPIAAKLAARIRNQANCVIAYHLGESADATENGEFTLIEHLAPHISTFIDVGANIGDWSEQMLKHSKSEGFLFEPSLQCTQRLKDRFLDRKVSIRDVAVSDEVGTKQFVEEDNCGVGSSLAETRSDDSGWHTDVAVTSLDTEFPDPAFRVDFLKIDTEGFDLKVLKGANNLLSRTRFLQFEYNSHWVSVGSSLAEANRFLHGLGFSVVLVRSTGLHPLRYDLWNDYFRYSNYFAYRSADDELIRPLLRESI